MDFIERLFHISPDGGSGSTELGLLVGALAALAILWWGRSRTHRPGPPA